MKNAGVQIEYGKNYDGLWNGAMFVQQVIIDLLSFIVLLLTIMKLKEKIIPEFEQLHCPNYQALIMVDNSQGHGIFASDTLWTCDMNFNPAGSQPTMHSGWFVSQAGE